jgi:predicted pyridoxine 5'-phosphate oxidase superfamily flavin-nucleotide-binding protein
MEGKMEWKTNFMDGKELVLATSSKSGNPNANIVESLGFVGEKILIADSQMITTINNLKENKRIVVVNGYLRINGSVEIYNSGKYFDICVSKNETHKVKNAILVNVETVFDLDNQKILFQA